MDHVTPERRSWLMSRISSRNTKPELAVRRLLHGLGYRFRIHYGGLPGKPDIVFTRRKKAIFVHGCFWHGHVGCRYAKLPATRADFWTEKMRRNRERDIRTNDALVELGWGVMIVWQCELKEKSNAHLTEKLVAFLGPPKG
ncbi:very short patch repair endonuclease [Paraburkholderia nodosa]|uniref:very short patch repair endonuclease n=1 Tax=Paraburkholderia nodosa TaxID=392320 RepID=UPI0009F1FC13|nr:very short patch repair endonuclease [Paraburkholderia nodosa]